MKAGDALRAAVASLRAEGIDEARLEARLLLAHALGVDRSVLIDRDREIDAPRFESLLQRRLAHEPLALITGHQGFWTLDLAVSPATLIPRADSETLVTAAIAAFPGRKPEKILDLGTGTGCLLLACLVEFPQALGIGVDLSPAAASLARSNARTNHLSARALFLAGNWASAVHARFDLVLSNPPYIPHADIAGLMPEVALHEPASALDGGPDGLDAYRRIMSALPELLTPNGVAILELGMGQAAAVGAIAAEFGLENTDLCQDLGGIARAMVLKPQKSFGIATAHR